MGSPLERLIRESERPLRQHNVYVGLNRTSDAGTEPASLAQAKLHCRIETGVTEDDTLITALIVAARTYVEDTLNRALITQTWELVLDTFPSGNNVLLPKGPLQSITSITTYDEADAASVFTTSGYRVDTYGDRATLVDGYSWPTDLRSHNGVVITYVTGYGDASTDIPPSIIQAIFMLIAHWYENREAVSEKAMLTVPMGVDLLLTPYKRLRI